MDEFGLIRQHFAGLTASREGVALGIGDDAALLAVPTGFELAVTSDTLIEGRHFPFNTAPFDIGFKALAVNLSDLAAMGGEPRWFTLALTLPQVDDAWLQAFAAGLKTLADAHHVALVGGDTTRGALSLTITAMGLVPAGLALRRNGAKVGDVVVVTGTLGDAALGLKLALADSSPQRGEGRVRGDSQAERTISIESVAPHPPLRVFSLAGDATGISGRLPNTPSPPGRGKRNHLLTSLNRPTPRVEAGLALRGLAHAAIDVSDGLAADLAHILTASHCGAVLDASALPRSEAFAEHAGEAALDLQLHGGDDYELCLTLPRERFPIAQAALQKLGVPLTAIGEVTAEPGLRLREGGALRTISPRGYNHFEAP